MADQASRNIRLGVFVLAGTALLIVSLYLIGNKQNLFGSTFRINAKFHNVDGLMKGNNVRFSGIDVGTVESVKIVNDSSVSVIMVLEKQVQPFIKKNAIASVGTDGLMGNKLVNINSVKDASQNVEENDELETLRPIEMDDMVRTLNVTNENMRAITGNLRNITDKINSKNTLWSLLMDTIIAENVKSTVVNIKMVSNQSAIVTGNLRDITEGLKNGKGSIGALITDTLFASKINQTIVKLEKVSDTAAVITGSIAGIIENLKQGKGSMGILLRDTIFVHNLNKSMENIKDGARGFDQNMEALKHTWPFKKYYRKQAKSKNQ